jgi:hypothetical protein
MFTYQIAYLQKLSTMRELKDLAITFIKGTADPNALRVLKNLCSKLDKFIFTFVAPSASFTGMLENNLSSEYAFKACHKRGCVLKSS